MYLLQNAARTDYRLPDTGSACSHSTPAKLQFLEHGAKQQRSPYSIEDMHPTILCCVLAGVGHALAAPLAGGNEGKGSAQFGSYDTDFSV